MLRFAADECFNDDIVSGLLRERPDLDIVHIIRSGLRGSGDALDLEWAARDGRILLTHDVATMTGYAYKRIAAGLPTPGVFEIPKRLPVRTAIDEILIIAECSRPEEWDGQVRYLTL